MARLIPDTALTAAEMTLGEKKLVRGLYQNLDDECVVWYQPKLPKERRPDAIVYMPTIGLLLYEVKDWSLRNIVSANPDVWELNHGERTEKHTNPFKQARGYFYELQEKCKRVAALVYSDGKHAGKVKLPMATCVAFPNIGYEEFLKSGFEQTLDAKYILFKEDIAEIGATLTGKLLRDRLREAFDPWWPSDELEAEELNALRGILYPEITAQQRDKGGNVRNIILDENQEQVAKKIGAGHKIVRGVAGSGKSLVLCSKIRLLLEEKPDYRILLTCYNISLVSQLRYYLHSFSDMAGATEDSKKAIEERVQIVHFHGLCSNLFSQTHTKWPFINEEQIKKTARFQNLKEHEREAELDELSSALLGQELQKVALTNDLPLYNAIMVDESQDFHPSWMKALTLLLDGKSNFLLLAEDPNQKIYPRTFSYKDAGVDVVGGGKIFNLPMAYRSTKEIVLTASKLVKTSDWDKFYKDFIEETATDDATTQTVKAGMYPQIIIKPEYEDACDFIAHDIQEKLKGGYKFGDIGIIYLTTKKKDALAEEQLKLFDTFQDVHYVNGLRARLAAGGIPNFWLSQDREAKRAYDQFREEVTITTLFSAKGLEFEIVYLVGLELYPWCKRNQRENASMLYVAMTRAKSELFMLSTEKTKTVNDLEKIMTDLKQA